MESDHPGSDPTESTETDAPTPERTPTGPPDPSTLVERLIESAEWPDPVLVATDHRRGRGGGGAVARLHAHVSFRE